MHFSAISSTIALVASLGSAAPTGNQFPDDGFPNPSPAQLKTIELKSFGTVPNGAPPAKLSQDTLTSLRLVAFNEIFEAAYFQSMLHNLTTDDAYFNIEGVDKNFAIDTVKSIVGVEEIHGININNALHLVGKAPAIVPCEYVFPVTDFRSAIDLAARFTDIVVGTLQDVIVDAAGNGDAALAPGVIAASGDESEQTGWFRTILGRRPNAQPFLTRSVRDYAFSLIQDVTVPGSCAKQDATSLRVLQPLSAKDPQAHDQIIEFSFPLTNTRAVPEGATSAYDATKFQTEYGKNDGWKQLTISYLNGQNNPVTVPLKGFRTEGNTAFVTADFPQQENLFFGLVIATLTKGDKFADATSMAAASIYGPAALEVQEAGSRRANCPKTAPKVDKNRRMGDFVAAGLKHNAYGM